MEDLRIERNAAAVLHLQMDRPGHNFDTMSSPVTNGHHGPAWVVHQPWPTPE